MQATPAQAPIGSGFNAASTADEVIAGIDLGGKIAIVTGGYAGIGLETVRVLRAAGARVILPARDLVRARAAVAGLDVEVAEMDLIDPASIDAFAAKFLASGSALHILVNNAGIMAGPLVRDKRGYEAQFATNHLGHFQLTGRLWPALARANGARVVSLSSFGHHFSPVIFDDPHFVKSEYDPWKAYGQSKTANVLFAVALDARGKVHNVRALAVHPGTIVGTSLSKHVSNDTLRNIGCVDDKGEPVLDPLRNWKTRAQGASTTVWCASSPRLNNFGGVYCENTEVSPLEKESTDEVKLGASVGRIGVMPYAVDSALADRLWSLSQDLTGVRYL